MANETKKPDNKERDAPDTTETPAQIGVDDLAAPTGEEQPEPMPGGDASDIEVPEKSNARNVIDFPAPDTREPWEKTQAELDAEEAAKKPRRGRPAKGDKAAPDKGGRDKVSRSGKGKGKTGPEQAAAGGAGGSPAAPAVSEPQEPTPPPHPVEEGKVVYLKLSELHPFHTFRDHPFQVKDDEKMTELVGTIKAHGVMTPATVRPEKDGNGYEIIAGHRRQRGSELAGLEELPCIVRDMTDHEAVQEMKNSNKQRGDPLPSELARLLDLEMEDIKHQGGRLSSVAAGDIGKRSAEIVGENNGMN